MMVWCLERWGMLILYIQIVPLDRQLPKKKKTVDREHLNLSLYVRLPDSSKSADMKRYFGCTFLLNQFVYRKLSICALKLLTLCHGVTMWDNCSFQ